MGNGSLIPEHFVEKLFNQVKEASDKNSNSIDRLTDKISKFADIIKRVSSHDVPKINEKCIDLIEISKSIKKDNENFYKSIMSYSDGFKKINDFEVDSYKEERREMLKILRWISSKFKIFIVIFSLFFILTTGSYTVIKYFNENRDIKIIQMVKEENNKLLIQIKKENNLMKEEIKENNRLMKEEIFKKMKHFHPDLKLNE